MFVTFILECNNPLPTSTYISVEQLQPFERDLIVGLWEARWTYQWIAAHVGRNISVVCRCFQQCLCNIPTPVDQVLDGRVVQMHVKIERFSTDARQDRCIA